MREGVPSVRSQGHSKCSIKVGCHQQMHSTTPQTLPTSFKLVAWVSSLVQRKDLYQYNGINSQHKVSHGKAELLEYSATPHSHASALFPIGRDGSLCSPHAHSLLSRDKLISGKGTACETTSSGIMQCGEQQEEDGP